jgi:hypothetical protein
VNEEPDLAPWLITAVAPAAIVRSAVKPKTPSSRRRLLRVPIETVSPCPGLEVTRVYPAAERDVAGERVKRGDQPPIGGVIKCLPSGILPGVHAPFMAVFLVGAGLLALWIDTRFPKLAPKSFTKRMLATGCLLLVFGAVPVFGGSSAAIYATLFAVMLPLLVSSLLAAVWLLRALRDAQFNN